MTAVTVSANDLANSVLQGEITNLGTQITAANAAGNYPLAAELTTIQTAKQIQLVSSLVAQGSISAATILAGSAAVYTVPPQFSQGPIPL
jgi:hypothetical protein